jgi:hypothetical protein
MPRIKPAAASASAGTRIFPVYLQLQIGGRSRQQLVKSLEAAGCYVGDCARDMIARPGFATAASARAIKLARVQLRALGFTDWVAWSDIFKAVAKLGGEKLPAEAALHLRLDLPQQQPGDHFWMLMDPIEGADDEPYVFYLVSHDDGERRLLGRYVGPGRRFYPHRQVVFGLRE